MNILLVDDERDFRNSLANYLEKIGHKIFCAKNGISGLRFFHQEKIDLVITDIRMPGMDGIELLRRIKKVEQSSVDVIVITGHGDIDNAIKAIKYDAFDYLKKPININELVCAIERSADHLALRKTYFNFKENSEDKSDKNYQTCRIKTPQLREAYLKEVGMEDVYIFSDKMRQLIRQADKYGGDRSIPLLIEGESGTGKEIIARYSHHIGQKKRNAPFIAINCGALPENLIESELFGHESGAYTGATRKGRIGKLEAANGGTIFFDEIGEMPLNLQVKLLRVLEEKKLYRLGGIKEIPVDIRIVCATNKDLYKAVSLNQFRLDLYYRISIGQIRIPPLRDQKEAILPFAYRFVCRALKRRGIKFERFSPSAEKFLVEFPWPGNVRQLENVMERLALFKNDGQIDLDDLSFIQNAVKDALNNNTDSLIIGQITFDLPDKYFDLELFNRDIIRKALKKNNGNQTQTAKYLGISRRTLQGRLLKMGAYSNRSASVPAN